MERAHARLTSDWNLRGWSDLPAALVDRRSSHLREISPDALYALRGCDGATDLSSPVFLPRHRALVERYAREGVVEYCAAGGAPAPATQGYRRAVNPLIWSVVWSVTGRCNLRCRHCYLEAPEGRYGEPSTEEALAVIDQLDRANVMGVALSGGEPLLRRDLPELLAAIVDRRMRLTEVISNGTLLDHAFLDLLEDLGERPLLKISFDGVGAHDGMRGVPGAEARTLAAVRLALEAGHRVAVMTSIDTAGAAVMPATYEALRELGVTYWLVGRPQATGDWCGARTGLALPEMAAVCEDLVRRWLADDRPFFLILKGFFAGRAAGALTAEEAGHTAPGAYTAASYECGSLREKPYLLPDGTLIPCQGYAGTSVQDGMPNLNDDELADVWTSSRLRDFIDVRKERVLEHEPECRTCEHFGGCGAGCRAYALTESGELFAREPDACELWRGGLKRRFQTLAGLVDEPGPLPQPIPSE